MVKALVPMTGNCVICDNGIILPYHDREIGWVCSGCVGHVNWADYLLQCCKAYGITRPTGKPTNRKKQQW